MATKLDLIYAAGIFDGEGCVNLAHNKSWSNIRYENAAPRITIQCSVVNTYRPLIKWFEKTFGGRLRTNRNIKKLRPEHKMGYVWLKSEQEAAIFLRSVRPFLKVKHKQADLAIRLAERKAANHSHRHLSKREVQVRFTILRKLRELNHRGQ